MLKKILEKNEIRESNLNKADYLTKIGEKDKAVNAYRITTEKTVALGQKLDIVFTLIRIGFFYKDNDLILRNIEKAKSLVESGGDWDRRNRLKVYEAVYCMSIRDFKKACTLFLETLSTFTSYELFNYDTFIFYTVLLGVLTLDRVSLKSKVITAPEVLQAIFNTPSLNEYLNSLYNCNYSQFFVSLANLSDKIKTDMYLAPHLRFYSREVRIVAYSQLLESYRSVQIRNMAHAFGVSTEFLDSELSRFIASGRLHCKIDKVGGIVETNRPDAKNAQYQATIKQGDLLLNRIQKLSRVINL